MSPKPRFEPGTWAVVTGGSEGIGAAFADALAERGINLLLAARRRERLEEVAARARAAGVEARVCAVDLLTAEGVAELAGSSAQLDVSIFVGAAGFGTSGAFVDAPLERELAMVTLNCHTLAAQAHHFAQRLRQRGGGSMVMMSSLVAFQGVPQAANYAATKAFVQTLAEGLRHELRPHGVRVVACAPGPVHSGFARVANMKMGAAAQPKQVAEATLRGLGRWGTVRPGALAKLLMGSLALLPRWAKVRVMALVMGGMVAPARTESARSLA